MPICSRWVAISRASTPGSRGRRRRARRTGARIRYSGIIRLLDLSLGAPDKATHGLFLVAPDDREDEVRAQLARLAFQRVRKLEVRYLPYGEIEEHRAATARFGAGLKAINAISRTLI